MLKVEELVDRLIDLSFAEDIGWDGAHNDRSTAEIFDFDASVGQKIDIIRRNP